MAEYATFQRVETTEYQMYRLVSRYVAIVVAFDSLLMLFAARLAAFPIRLVVSLLGVLFAMGLLYLRHRLYLCPNGADFVTDPRAERHRDWFGAFCLILAIPVSAFCLTLIGLPR
ncbi:MAG: hypothetical protein NXI07_13530 [bacterium]|nr:hypothetical protein [bacterium]